LGTRIWTASRNINQTFRSNIGYRLCYQHYTVKIILSLGTCAPAELSPYPQTPGFFLGNSILKNKR
jgi:hypothetical protein